jgi:hypothetical protein
VGDGYSTTFTLLNTGSTSLTGQLRVFDQDGSLRSTPSEWTNISLPASGSARFTLPNVGPLTPGSAYFETSGTVQGVATFELRQGEGPLQTMAGVIGVASASRVLIPVDISSSGGTGIAIMNTQSTNTNVRLRLISETGSEVANLSDTRLNPLQGRTQIANFVTDLFSNLGLSNFRGTLIAEATGGSAGIAATGILVKDGLLSTLPVVTSFTPPTTTAPTTSTSVWVNVIISAFQPFSFTLQNRTITLEGGPYFFSLAPGTYEATGQFSSFAALFLLGGGSTPNYDLSPGGVQRGSIRSLQGPNPSITSCGIDYFSTSTGAQSFRFQFTVTSSNTNACGH